MRSSYRPDIDGLRAFAVISVVLYHAFPDVVRGGFVGVDVFFVISGYLISSLMFTEMKEKRFTFANFYSRRIRRIFPALAICLITVLAYGFVCLTPPELAHLGKHVFFGAGFLSNIALWSESGYFDDSAVMKPLLHLWSLGIEEQFYIAWPLLLWGTVKARVRVSVVLISLLLTSFVANILMSNREIVDAFYLPIPRFWEFLAGAATAYRRVKLTPKQSDWVSAAGYSALLISVVAYTPDLRFPSWFALPPVAGTVAIIIAGPEGWTNRVMLSNRMAVQVGLISYPLYLWHWPPISFAYIFRFGKAPTPLMALILIVASFLLAWATYRFVERPIRFGQRRDASVILIAGAMAIIGMFGAVVWFERGFPQRFPAGVDIQKLLEAQADAMFQPTEGMKVLKNDWIVVGRLGHGERKAVFGGDSFLMQFGPRAQRLFDEGKLAGEVYFVSGPGCAPVPGVIRTDKFAACADLPKVLLEQVDREQAQTVMLGGRWDGFLGRGVQLERSGNTYRLDTVEGTDAFYANLEDFVRLLQGRGVSVYLALALPEHVQFDPRRMLQRGPLGVEVKPATEQISTAALEESLSGANVRLKIVAERTGAKLVDPFPDVCGMGDYCSPFFGAREPKFSDGMHLRPLFVQENIHFFDELLQ